MMVLVISTGMAHALAQGSHHVERVLDISTETSIPTCTGTISGMLPLLRLTQLAKGGHEDHSMDSGGADDELFRRDSTERDVHVGSSMQATSDINPQIKVMDFPFSW